MKKSITLVLILLFITSLGNTNSIAIQEEITYVVVYDEAHLQFFTNEMMTTALSGLNDSFDTNAIDVTIELEINKENFTDSNLQGADLLIIPSPNLREDKTASVNTQIGESERDAIEDFVNNGGGVLFMSNPYSNNVSLAGHADPMNKLIPEGFNFNSKLGLPSVNDGDNVTVIVSDFNNDGNNSRIYFSADFINGGVWDVEINEISQVLFYGSSVNEDFTSILNGNSTSLAYSVNKDYTTIADEIGQIRWMVGNSFGSNDGRGVLVGSTIMFSEMPYDNQTKWVEQVDNQELFENLVAWLLKITPLNVPADVVDDSFGRYLTTNIVFGLLLPGALLLLVFGTLLRSKAIKASNILSFKTKIKETKKATSEKVAKKRTTVETKKKTSKKQRRKRN